MRVPPSLHAGVWRIVSDAPWPPRSAADADAFVRECMSQGTFALAFEDESLPDEIRAALDSARAMNHANRVRTDILLRAMRRVGKLLIGEEFVLLKGCDYLFRLYDAPHLRQMADIDLLVPDSRMEAVHERFRAAEMPQQFPSGGVDRLPSHHETVFKLGDVTIEVHRSFIQRARNRIDYDALWSRRVRANIPGVDAFRLSDADALLYHALGLAIKEFDVPLVRYFDLCLMLEQFRGDVAELAQRAREWHIERALYASLRQLVIVFPELAPRVEPLTQMLLSETTRNFIDTRVVPSPFRRRGPQRRRDQLWRKWQLMDGYRERLGFLAYQAWALAATRLSSRA
ncbi:MAG: hypothetical protein QOI24_1328 [Acidobacteriota bacterium]|nr:hypothetical protein [Acidobacteriota bacterium]